MLNPFVHIYPLSCWRGLGRGDFKKPKLYQRNNTSNRFGTVNIDRLKINFSQHGFVSQIARASGRTAYVEAD
jgi:hypothetical protein